MFKTVFGKRKLMVGLAIVGVAAGLLAITVGVASAHGGGFGFGGRNGDAFLAEELDISVEELEAAKEAAHDQAMTQALDEGLITQEQYDQMQVAKKLKGYIDREALMAEALGISVEELAEQPLNDWLDELGIDREAFREAIETAREAAIAQAVTDGVITQEQADALPQRGMMGPRRGRGGMRGGCPEGDRRGFGERPEPPSDGEAPLDSGLRGRRQVSPSDDL